MTKKLPRYRLTATGPQHTHGGVLSQRVLWWAARRDMLDSAHRHACRQGLDKDPAQECWRMTTHLQSPMRVGGAFAVTVGDTTLKLERLY